MKKNILLFIILGIASLQLSCEKFVEIDPPIDSFVQETIFRNDDVATSAVTGIYSIMAGSGFTSGGYSSISSIGGLSADELINYNIAQADFYLNELTPISGNLNASLYLTPYQHIYTCNSIIEGLSSSSTVTPPVKTQLQGEAYFVRAFNYFYLVNLFGAVPLQLVTDYRITRTASRTPVSEVYKQVIADLKTAEALLTDKYVTIERVRPNLSAVQALLARVYLYTQDWSNAEKYSSLVISKSATYSLTGLSDIFLKNSKEAIWQLFPTSGNNTQEGNLFILVGTPPNVSLANDFVLNAFEADDKRKAAWVRTFTNTTGTYYYPYKYKVRQTATVTEYSMVLRLAEQFLIRSEARAMRNDYAGAIEDIDQIRDRAGLTLYKNTNPGISKEDLLAAILKERRIELFSEWGHRWLDLKRMSQASAVLKPIKSNWQDTDVLYPIPYEETSRNSRIEQNLGY